MNYLLRPSAFVSCVLVSGFIASSATAVSTENGFSGFISSVAITQLMVEVYPSPAGVNFAAADNLYFGVVPAPGAAALLGLAALVSRRRR